MTLIVSFTSKLQNITCSINGPRNTLRYKVGSEVTINTQIWDLYERNFIVRRQLCNFHCHFPHKVIKSIDLYAATNSKGGHSNLNQSLKGHKQTIAYFRNFGVFLVDIAMISEIERLSGLHSSCGRETFRKQKFCFNLSKRQYLPTCSYIY